MKINGVKTICFLVANYKLYNKAFYTYLFNKAGAENAWLYYWNICPELEQELVAESTRSATQYMSDVHTVKEGFMVYNADKQFGLQGYFWNTVQTALLSVTAIDFFLGKTAGMTEHWLCENL